MSPNIALIREDLPLPTSPIIHTNSPFLKVKLTLFRMIESEIDISFVSVSFSSKSGALSNDSLRDMVSESSSSLIAVHFFFDPFPFFSSFFFYLSSCFYPPHE
jgi:hypothetical protein